MRTIKLEKFMDKLYKKNAVKRNPVSAVLELTYACNHKCVHCYNPKGTHKKELSKEDVFSCINQLANMGIFRIVFTGGEIFTRPDIMDIILYARNKGLQVTLMTNASLITKEIADKLIRWGVSNLEISFLGSTKETFDKMTKIDGSFKKVLSAIKTLRRKGLIPRLKTCVTSINLEEIDKIAVLAGGLDVSFGYSPHVIPALDKSQEPARLRINPEQSLDIREKFLSFNNKKPDDEKRRQNTEKRDQRLGFWERECLFNCMAGHTTMFINPYGEMKVCLTLPEPRYDIRRYGVYKSWKKVKEFVDTLKPSSDWECFTCEYQNWCSWCPGRGYLNRGEIFGCPSYFRELAKVRKERNEKPKTERRANGQYIKK